MITAEELRARLNYDPETGVFTWKNIWPGSVAAGGYTKQGYITIGINRRAYRAHRLAWLYVYGVWPSKDLDHINRDPSDNRIANLREATVRENQLNTPPGRSGVKGVSWVASIKKWSTQIWVKGTRIFLGYYDDITDAAAHYQWARLSYDREFF